MPSHVALVAALLALASPALAQPGGEWVAVSSGGGPEPLDGEVSAVAYAPDGTLYAGGQFASVAGGPPAVLARWAPGASGWAAVPGGVDGPVRALRYARGRLYVGGAFGQAGGADAENVAALDLASGAWRALGGGVSQGVVALDVAPDGVLYASDEAGQVLQWEEGEDAPADGPLVGEWETLGSAQSVQAVAVRGNGVAVAGSFSRIGGVEAENVAAWTPGGGWEPVGEGQPSGLRALAVGPDGALYVGGRFGVARWAGAAWEEIGAVSSEYAAVHALALTPEGRLLAAGTFSDLGGEPAAGVAAWDGADGRWTGLAEHVGGIYSAGLVRSPVRRALAVGPGGAVALGGLFSVVDTVGTWNVAVRDGGGWSGRGSAVSGPVVDLAVGPEGRLGAVGGFPAAGQTEARHVARWDPEARLWSRLGDGVDDVIAVHVGAEGAVYAGGGAVVRDDEGMRSPLARWDPESGTWVRFSAGFDPIFPDAVVTAFAEGPDGRLYAGGYDLVLLESEPASAVVWDEEDERWEAVTPDGGAHLSGEVLALAVGPDGKLYAGGDFDVIPQPFFGESFPNVAQIDASGEWAAVGEGLPWPVRSLAAGADGRLYAGGSPIYLGDTGAAVFADGAWAALPGGPWDGGLSGPVVVGSEGAVYAAGPAGDGATRLARWDPGLRAWTALGDVSGPVYALAFDPERDLYVGGAFSRAGGVFSPHVALRTGVGPTDAKTAPAADFGVTVAPNPASGRVRLAYALPEAGAVRLAVYDVLGREVAAVLDGLRPAGPGEAAFDAGGLAPGVYVVRLSLGGRAETRALTVVR